MNKRGPICIGLGMLLIVISFGVAFTALPDYDPTMGSDLFMVNFLDMFDHVTHETVIDPGANAVFSYSVQENDISLMWIAQMTDFEQGDVISVRVSNVYDDQLAVANTDESVVFDIIEVQDPQSYNFEITNDGTNSVTVMMMFAEVSESSDILNNDNSAMATMIVSLLISGFLLMAGMVLAVVGTIIFVIDWKKEKSS